MAAGFRAPPENACIAGYLNFSLNKYPISQLSSGRNFTPDSFLVPKYNVQISFLWRQIPFYPFGTLSQAWTRPWSCTRLARAHIGLVKVSKTMLLQQFNRNYAHGVSTAVSVSLLSLKL